MNLYWLAKTHYKLRQYDQAKAVLKQATSCPVVTQEDATGMQAVRDLIEEL